jgi:aspartate/methionine/tyrosine aminotransferase
MTLASNIIRLDLGEPYHSPPPAVLKAFTKISRSSLKYGPRGGIDSLKKLIYKKVELQNNINLQNSNIILTTGASLGIFAVLSSLTKPGDYVLIPNPGYPSYTNLLKILNLVGITYNSFVPEESIYTQIQIYPKISIVIWNYPNNPTGVVPSKSVIQELVKEFERKNIYFISDETYEDFIYDGKHASPASLTNSDKFISVFSLSKKYGIPGLRLGYVVSHKSLATKIESIQWTVAMTPSLISQKLGIIALKSSDSYIKRVILKMRILRDLSTNILLNSNLEFDIPQGGFYHWIQIPNKKNDSLKFVKYCLENKQVLIMPGKFFGSDSNQYVRISFTNSRKNVVEGFNRIVEAMNS